MRGSAVVYVGLLVAAVGLAPLARPSSRLGVPTGGRAGGFAAAGLAVALTRVFANSAPGRRRFAAYWRVIYPGSALILRMWLRAIEKRAMDPAPAASG